MHHNQEKNTWDNDKKIETEINLSLYLLNIMICMNIY